MGVAAPGQLPPPSGPPQLADASNNTAVFVVADPDVTRATATGVSAGGRMTPVGTRRIITCSGLAPVKSVEVAVATIDTQLPTRPLHVPNTPLDGLTGAV